MKRPCLEPLIESSRLRLLQAESCNVRSAHDPTSFCWHEWPCNSSWKMTKWTSHLCKMTQNDINLQTLCARLLRACCQGKILWILVLCRCAFYGCRRLLQHISPCRARGSPAHKKQIQVTYKHFTEIAANGCRSQPGASGWGSATWNIQPSACVCCRCEYFMIFWHPN